MQHNSVLDVVAGEEGHDELDLLWAEQEVHSGHIASQPRHRGPASNTVL